MALYDYRCTSCEKVFEFEHPMRERPEVFCPSCGKRAERVFEPSGIAFHGSGFYNTDQRGSGTASAPGSTVAAVGSDAAAGSGAGTADSGGTGKSTDTSAASSSAESTSTDN